MDEKVNQEENKGIRLNKYIAHCGLCSRRKAADLVKAGEIKVNGEVEINPSYFVQDTDVVQHKNKTLNLEKGIVYYLMNKPRNVITTTSDEKGRKTVMDIVKPKIKERVFPVGRLDRNTTGLLVITNDGQLAQKLAHPSFEVKKIYHVVCDKPILKEHIQAIKDGITLEDGDVSVNAVYHIEDKPENEAGIEIHIGRNRIVRRIFEHFGYSVEQLDRVYYAGLTKKGLPRGWFRPLTEQEVIMLKHFV